MTISILAAGDHFVLPSLLVEALRSELGAEADIVELTLPWPMEPFGPVAEVDEASGTEEVIIEALQDRRICVTQLAPVTARVLESCPELELVAVSRGGPVNVNIQAATRNRVAICYAPGRNAQAAAEYTVGVMLAALRRIPASHRSLREEGWKGEYYTYESCGFELQHTTVGLIGYGAIGSRVARILEAFGATILVYDPYVESAQLEGGAQQVGLEELLERSKVVSLHARATPETRGMIGEGELGLMPPESILVNTSRGSLVDEDALCEALRSGHLAAAALDVFSEEPISRDSCLLDEPNLVMTPHIAGASRETAQRASRIVAADVARYVRGEELAHCANPEVVQRRHES